MNADNINNIITLLNKYNMPITFVGDGATTYKELITNNFDNCIFTDNNNLTAYSLGLAGFISFQKNIIKDIKPLYLRKSQAERALEEKKNNLGEF